MIILIYETNTLDTNNRSKLIKKIDILEINSFILYFQVIDNP